MGNPAAWPPLASISLATSASLLSLRAAKATEAPPSAKASAQARPIPCEAPVTSATRLVTPAIAVILLYDQTPDYKRGERQALTTPLAVLPPGAAGQPRYRRGTALSTGVGLPESLPRS